MRATAQRRNRAPRGDRAFWDQLASIAAEPRNHVVHQRIVGGAVDLGDRDPVLDTGKHADLPVGDMAGEEDHPPAGRDRSIHVFEAVRLDSPAPLEDADFQQMRVFGRNAAEIVPHAGDDARDLGLRKFGKGVANVAPSIFGDAQKGANVPCQRTADGGSAIERQELEPAEQSRRSPGLQTIGNPERLSAGAGRELRKGGLPCAGIGLASAARQCPSELAHRLLMLLIPDLGKVAGDLEQHPLVRCDLARTFLTKTFVKIGDWHAQRAGNLK
jgi:hypothetical protein